MKTACLKIVDFGVAAARSSGDTQLTKTGYVIGSPKYMAPEQILGKPVDEKADVYSLGVIMYELLTGVPPYTRGDHMSVMYQHVQGKARAPEEINPTLPSGLTDIIKSCMAVDKAKRFSSMVQLHEADGRIPALRVSWRHGAYRFIPQAGSGPGLLGHPSCGRRSADAATARRSHADQVPRAL